MKQISRLSYKSILLIAVLFLTSGVILFADDSDAIFNMDIPIIYGEENFIERIESLTGGTREPVGLVLSGGSARAFAHIGVLRYLEEAGIIPDFIVSNSMGSIVGLLYGAGLSPDQIYELIESTDIGNLFQLSLPISGGLLNVSLFTSLIHQYLGELDLADLPIPVMVICEDLIEKREIRITEGDFYTVMEAAYALPVYFSPIQYKDRLLIDGGISNLVPLNAAYQYTDQVIASTTFYQNPNLNLKNPLTILNVAMDINKSRTGIRQIKDFDPLLIRCSVEQFSFMDFASLKEISDAGYQSAKDMSPNLKLLDSSQGNTKLWETRDEFTQQIALELRNYQYNSRIVALKSSVIADIGIENNFYPNTASYLLDDIYVSAGIAGAKGSLKGRASLGGIWDIYDSMAVDLALQLDAAYSPLYFLRTKLRFRQALDLSGNSNTFGTYYIRAALEAVPYADTANRVDLPVSFEISGIWDAGVDASLLTAGARYSLLSTTERKGSGFIEAGYQFVDFSRNELYGESGLEVPIMGDFAFSQRLFSRIPLDGGSKVSYYNRDYMRSALPEDIYNANVISSTEFVFSPSAWKPSFAELIILKNLRISGYADMGLFDRFLWAAGIQMVCNISLIGLNPLQVSVFTGYDSYSGGITAGIYFR
ncbi:MAG: patatin-like phospholipase family protein [Bacteroidetes bacterium]|nr:patatin-like phospholipase family protein [Bacteroidota bacterium]